MILKEFLLLKGPSTSHLKNVVFAIQESILLNLSGDEVLGLVHLHLTETNFSEILKSQDFDENCRILMNRSTLAQTTDLDIALAWLDFNQYLGNTNIYKVNHLPSHKYKKFIQYLKQPCLSKMLRYLQL